MPKHLFTDAHALQVFIGPRCGQGGPHCRSQSFYCFGEGSSKAGPLLPKLVQKCSYKIVEGCTAAEMHPKFIPPNAPGEQNLVSKMELRFVMILSTPTLGRSWKLHKLWHNFNTRF